MIPPVCAFFSFQKYAFIGLYEEMEQMPMLVQWLISLGASVETIGRYPLHALMRLCIQAGKCPPVTPPNSCPSWVWVLGWAQEKPEFSHMQLEYSSDWIFKWMKVAGKAFLFLLGLHSLRRPTLKGFCFPRQILAAEWTWDPRGNLGQRALAGWTPTGHRVSSPQFTFIFSLAPWWSWWGFPGHHWLLLFQLAVVLLQDSCFCKILFFFIVFTTGFGIQILK